jgi:probable DNA repair protein
VLWPRRLHSLLRRSGDLTRPRSFAEWTEFVRELLRTVQWPGPLSGSSQRGQQLGDQPGATAAETAAAQAWDSTLDLVATLDFAGRRVPFATAREALQREAEAAAFAVPATHAPVQVMSFADSEGCICDAAVMLRATDANWPPPARPNPLLPWPLQRSLGMPGADLARTAARALSFTRGLLDRSGNALFTFAVEDADGHLRPSPLLAELGLPTRELSELAAPSTQTSVDDSALAAPSGMVAGGSRVLKLQAACGFLAFAELRLRAAEPDTAGIGLDPAASGSVLHQALQSFWAQVHSQAGLRALPSQQRADLLARCIDEALGRTARPISDWDKAYLALQKQRQLSLLQSWLESELERQPFTVAGLEDERQVTVGPLTLSVRMDRIDAVDGGVLLVDYKTGSSAHPSHWEGERPDDPQLPLYTLLNDPAEIKGLAFAQVRAGHDMRWQGYQTEPGVFPGRGKDVIADLPERVAEWRAVLTQLAEDFYKGRAGVRPKSYAVNCAHCSQRLLCRLDPATLLEIAQDDPKEADPEGFPESFAGQESQESIDG